MANWRYQMGLHEIIYDAYGAGDVHDGPVFEGFRDRITTKVKDAPDFAAVGATGDALRDIVSDLEGSEDSDEFNGALDDLYDWGDANLVWVG
jgi:hypothetical protein